MRFVDETEKVFGEVVDQCGWRFAWLCSRKVSSVVFDPIYVPDFAQHFDVVSSSLFETMSFDSFAEFLEFGQPDFEIGFDLTDGVFDSFGGGDGMFGRENNGFVEP